MLGKQFGLLTVVAKGPPDTKWRRSTWICKCFCGRVITTFGKTLRAVGLHSCGCVRYKAVSEAVTKYRTVEDFLANTKKRKGCMEWQGHLSSAGYASVGSYTAKTINTPKRSALVHRRVFELTHGKSPAVVMHTCDNRKCINPAHLAAGTQKDNVRDAVAKGRFNNSKRKYTVKYKGKTIGLAELSKLEGIPLATLQWRARNNKPIW
jgi:hypothetical protein